MATVLICGGAGLVGKHLAKQLIEKGYTVTLLSRSENASVATLTYKWDIDKKEIEDSAIDSVDYIINLAGAGIADKRWTAKRKQVIRDSRIKSTQLLFDKVKERNKTIKAFITASAIGYYGTRTSEKIYTETDNPATDFLGETCSAWEKAADEFAVSGVRTVKLRAGAVLSKQGGALEKISIPVKLGIGSALGTGAQYLPWIHIDDLCGIYIKAIEDSEMQGVYNAVAPEYITNSYFINTLARVLKKPFFFPNVPIFVLKMLLGELSDMLLKGSRVSAQKIQDAGFSFRFPRLNEALNDLIGK